MGRFDGIIEKLTKLGWSVDGVWAVMIIGSQTRSDCPADEWSDLDVVLCVDDVQKYLFGDGWVRELGDFCISFVEDTLGGGKERRVLFNEALDVDFVFVSRGQLEALVHSEDGEVILGKGYDILVDKIGIGEVLGSCAVRSPGREILSEDEFINLVNDFWYHVIWSGKKILRGELWTGKMCVDCYLKGLLLKLAEFYACVLHGEDYDTWHDGRFLDKWTERWIARRLPACFAHYNKKDIGHALKNTGELFAQIALEASEIIGYKYPHNAEKCAVAWVRDNINK